MLPPSGNKSYFIKLHKEALDGFYYKEARGLSLLKASQVVSVPRIYGYGEWQGLCYLLLEHIASAPLRDSYWKILGEQIANLHRCTSSYHGLDHDNYIGILLQKNRESKGWVDFFKTQRMLPQIELANKNFFLDNNDTVELKQLMDKLAQLLPESEPSLLHGDLWNGNVISDGEGKPVLIDPAVCYANREMEIAFTKLFGGFGKDFYDSYNNNYALEKDFDKRMDIYNLYPLLVHLNIFGRSYLPQIREVVKIYK